MTLCMAALAFLASSRPGRLRARPSGARGEAFLEPTEMLTTFRPDVRAELGEFSPPPLPRVVRHRKVPSLARAKRAAVAAFSHQAAQAWIELYATLKPGSGWGARQHDTPCPH